MLTRIMDKNTSKTKTAIIERLMYSFGFDYASACMELHFLFATQNILHTQDFYAIKVRRTGSPKCLNRGQRIDIHRAATACIEEHNG